MRTTLKIDTHAHILPREIPDFRSRFGYGGFVNLDHHKPNAARMMIDGQFFREVQANCFDPAAQLADCDRTGVDVLVVCTVPVMFSYWAEPEHGAEVARFLNDDIAHVQQEHPRRIVSLGTLPMQAPELAIRELERCVRELGLPGVQIGSNINNRNLDDPELFPIFEAAAELGACLLVHPWDMMGREYMQKYWLPWLVGMPAETSRAICSMIFGGVLERLPRLRVAFAHAGGSFPATIGRIEHGFNVRPDLVAVDNPRNPREYLGKFYLDTITHDPTMLQYIIDLVGVDCLMMGSDYPFPLGEHHPGRMIEEEMPQLTGDQRRRLLSGTALEWLNLEAARFM